MIEIYAVRIGALGYVCKGEPHPSFESVWLTAKKYHENPVIRVVNGDSSTVAYWEQHWKKKLGCVVCRELKKSDILYGSSATCAVCGQTVSVSDLPEKQNLYVLRHSFPNGTNVFILDFEPSHEEAVQVINSHCIDGYDADEDLYELDHYGPAITKKDVK